MEPESKPRAPFMGWPRQFSDAAYGFLWVTDEPAAFVTQSIVDTATVPMITVLHDVIDELISLGLSERPEGFYVVHDWRSIRTIAPGVRKVWQRRAERPGKPLQRMKACYVAVSASGVTRMAIQTAALAVQLATRQPPMRLVDDLAATLDDIGLRPPPRDLLARLRANKERR